MKTALAWMCIATALLGGCSAASEDASTTDESAVRETSTTVATTGGPVRGSRWFGVTSFKGIPFGASTGGERRWRAPEPPAPWTATRPATSYGAKCLQPNDDGEPEGDEDCLTVNVWRPSSGERDLPVLVFFYGGFNVTGSTADTLLGTEMYDGSDLAEGAKAIVVTANYRVGALGFLAHPSLATSGSGAGNYGLLDQIHALRWVHDNAAAFGGDASRVLVMGQSAGAFDTCALVASPLAKGLFSRAAMHSGGCRALPRANAESAAKIVADRVGCSAAQDVAACLRSQSPVALIGAVPLAEAAGGTFYWPVVDGAVLPKTPLEMIRAGEHNHVPILLGSTTDEASLIVKKLLPTTIDSEASYQGAVRALYPGAGGEAVLATYPAAAYASPDKAFQAAVGDSAFICPTRRAARAFAGGQTETVRRFEFTHSLRDLLLGPAGASHGFDLFFLFKNFVHWFPSSAEHTLADDFIGYWGRFAATGDPNGASAAAWAPYDAGADSALMLGTRIVPGAGSRGAQCDFWDRVAAASGE